MNKQIISSYVCVLSLFFGQVGLAEKTGDNSDRTESSKPEVPQMASMGTELGKFQHKLYLAIGSRWNLKIMKVMKEMKADRVVISFHVLPDGKMSNIDVVEGDPQSKLAVLSKEAVSEGVESNGSFPENLRKEKPDGFNWNLCFKSKE